MGKRSTMETNDELLVAVAGRYRIADRERKTRILDEIIEVTGHQRNYVIRVLNTWGPRSSPRSEVVESMTPQFEKCSSFLGKLPIESAGSDLIAADPIAEQRLDLGLPGEVYRVAPLNHRGGRSRG